MEDEYQFAVKKCTRCGQKLSGEHVELEGMKGPVPMGRCPKCGTAYPLVEVEPSEPCPVCGKTHKEGSAIGEEHKAEAEAKAKAEAQASIKEAVDNADLPEDTKARLIERFAEATTDDGVAEAIKAEEVAG